MSKNQNDTLESIELRDFKSNASSSGEGSPSKERTSSSASNETLDRGEILEPVQESKWIQWKTNFKDSFKRQEAKEVDPETQQPVKETKSHISARHVALIAVAGGLGTGLLVGNGKALTQGGPVGLLIAYGVIATMLLPTMQAASELAVAYSSLRGGFNEYASRLVDPSLGFAVAWSYGINWLLVLPLEMVAASMTIKYFSDYAASLNPDIFIAVFLPVIVCVNMFFGARGYAEVEFWLNLAKVTMLIGFIILGILVDTGVAGNQGFIGAKYFQELNVFANNGFKGVCAVFVNSAFSLGGTEFMALTAADQSNPRKACPSAIKQVFYRLVIFFFGSILILGLLVPYNSPQLMGSGHSNGAPVSPFVLAIESSGIKVIPHIINAVILMAVLSVGNSALYSSSRTLYSLSQQGFFFKWFDFIDRNNRPTRTMMLSSIVGLFSFIAAYDDPESIFIWLLALSGLATIFTWMSICISHIRFRAALKSQGINTNTLGYKTTFGTYGSFYALALNGFILVVQFWTSMFPLGNDGKADVTNFFQNYLGLFTFALLYFGHKIYTKGWFICIKSDEIDLVNGRQIFEADVLQQEAEEDARTLKNGPFWKRISAFLF